jgi:uncharacterized membrane protein
MRTAATVAAASPPGSGLATVHASAPLQFLPEGFALPPLPYLLALVSALLAVGAGLSVRRPAVTADVVVALVPWMVFGAAAHVLYVVDAIGPLVRPLLGTPAVYLAVAALAGATWLAADATGRPAAPVLAGAGGLAALLGVGAAFGVGVERGTIRFAVPLAGFVASVVVGAAGWVALRRVVPDATITEPVGVLVVFGHVLDGVSTAVGVDLLGFGERTPLSRVIIEFAAALPTAAVLGSGWLFVLVKLAVAGAVVALFVDYVREDPGEAYLLLGLVAAVGVGPGAHNLVLFAITG